MHKLNYFQRRELLDLLWEYMLQDSEHPNRVRTGWGTKTPDGLIASIERIFLDQGQ